MTSPPVLNKRKRVCEHHHAFEAEAPNAKRMRLSSYVSTNVQAALDNESFHDVEFVVGSGDKQQTFCGARIMYAMHSKVLEKMLFGGMQESQAENQVIIPDVVPDAFHFLTKLVYSYHPQLNYDIVIHVLYLSQKYLMEVLLQECKEYALSVNQLVDFYKVLNSFTAYPPSTFDSTFSVNEFLIKCKYSNQKKKHEHNQCRYRYKNVIKIMEHNKFMKLPVYIVQRIMKSKLISTEQMKYIHCKEYCRVNANDTTHRQHNHLHHNLLSVVAAEEHSNHSVQWQCLFKQHFMSLIDFSRIKSDFLLSTIRADAILSDTQLLSIWQIKTNRDKPGFKIEELILSYDECAQLKYGDLVDVRCCTGEIVSATIIPIPDPAASVSVLSDTDIELMPDFDLDLDLNHNHNHNNIGHHHDQDVNIIAMEIGDDDDDDGVDEEHAKPEKVEQHQEVCVVYKHVKDTPIQEFVSLDDFRLMINGCISSRRGIQKPCMQNLQLGQNVFVNMAYLPSKSYDANMDSWIECKIIGFWKQKKQIKVRSICEKMDGDYYFHPDSKDEVACSLECEYCCYN